MSLQKRDYRYMKNDETKRYEELLAQAVKESGGPISRGHRKSEADLVEEAILAVKLVRSEKRERNQTGKDGR